MPTREPLRYFCRWMSSARNSIIHVKDINQITGYIRGGCTAVGMKKQYKTVIDGSAQELSTMIVSGGRIGSQIELTPENLAKAANAVFAEIIA